MRHITRFVLWTGWASLASADFEVTHSTARLSSGRRDLGAASAGGKVYFAGGCADVGSAYVCDEPTAIVDIFTLDGKAGNSTLSEARGWPAGCASGFKVVFAGGGTGGKVSHSAVADVFDVSTGEAKSWSSALSEGRWGLACATVNGAIHFAGGKVVLSSGGFHMSDAVDTFENDSWSVSSFHLSQPRESMGAASGHGSLVFAGGWVTSTFGAGPVDTVDVISLSNEASKVAVSKLGSKAYWPGAAAASNGDIYVVGNKELSRFDGSTWTSSPLPADLIGSAATLEDGGAVPAAHVPQNGVAVGDYLCFYGWQSKKLSAVYCYDTAKATWTGAMNCDAVHRGGAIAALGSQVLVAGGYDPDNQNNPTDVVDIFDVNIGSADVII